ncbi:prolyl endopeptidase FAP-like isoform X1 [Hydractinia symbiolongicarpus]|uniref:prolyl endopeptidase FAP-like isoform X1 n=1 Tax=Hydractinia symbiolongicarpus TaxID=13093 RepID=UPI00254FC3AE|nr:prolyl endopeptidase FAP-like isoform X1 [Hydractinia symbiolongicarpus]
MSSHHRQVRIESTSASDDLDFNDVTFIDVESKRMLNSRYRYSEGLSNGSSRKLSKRQKAVLVSFIAITLVVVTTVTIILTQKKDWLTSSTRITRADRKFTLDEVLSGKYSYDSYSTQWVSDQNYLHNNGFGSLLQYNMDTMDTSEILTPLELSQSRIDRVKKISPDKKWFLFSNNTKSLYRHSFYADYYVKDLSNGKIKRIKTPDDEYSEQIRYCGWSEKDNALVLVYKCNIYYAENVTDDRMTYFEITKDGVPKKIFNGVPDWVYEEEIIASSHAIEFSPDGKYMAYVTFNATDVPFYKFPIYGSPSKLYTTIEKIAYPKAGYPNPTIKVNIINIEDVVARSSSTVRVRLQPPTQLMKGEYYYSVLQWSTDNKVFVQWLNRAQNVTYCMMYRPTEPVGTVVEDHKTTSGWIDDDYVKPPFAKDGSYYITMLPKNIPGKGDFRHLAKVTVSATGGTTTFLTSGDFTVQDINCFDADEEVVYFRSTESSPKYRHVYSYNVTTKEKKCVTCGLIKDSDGTDCTYYYPQFSKQCSWVTLMCQGPFVPITNMYGVKNNRRLILTSNNNTKASLAEKDVPKNIYYTVKSDDGIYDIPVKETRPLNFDRNKKYAVLFDVYGGPNTQKVTDKFRIGFDDYFVNAHDVIVISCDARGTGYYGYKYLYAVYRKLGYYESLDAIAVAKYLQKQSYVDPERIAIWGWSYGGFYSATTLAMAGDVIKTAVAVAPVTDWRYYDTVYSERYMGLPTEEDNLAGYERTAVMARAKDFAGKNFLLIHGTADDNVHFQNSAQLVAALIKNKIKFRSQYYPDRDHSIQSGGHIYYLIADYLLAHLKAGKVPGQYYGFNF